MTKLLKRGTGPAIDPDMPIDEIMRKWPMTIGTVIKHGMLCVGCPIGGFHTVSEACAEHDVDEDLFVDELVATIERF
ncbi:MAG: DUF1858 domain-containing protein [Rhizobiaceae bacterium]